MEINNLRELDEYGILEEDDRVIFHFGDEVLKYRVMNDDTLGVFLNMTKVNNRIFVVLNLNPYKICIEEYGYHVKSGSWPWAEPDDFKAITRVVRRLYKEIGQREEVKEDEIKTSRFSLIDLD